jgi:2,5-furandicarboxylate decarboxylase 1
LLTRFRDAVRRPLAWVEVENAPAQEVIHRKVDRLKLLPIPKHNEHDSGPW